MSLDVGKYSMYIDRQNTSKPLNETADQRTAADEWEKEWADKRAAFHGYLRFYWRLIISPENAIFCPTK